MGFYSEQLLPRVQDKVMDLKTSREVRARVCARLEGDVIEIGFGTGLNVRHYPPGVAKVAAIEPSLVCMRIAANRIAASPIGVQLAGLTGERLDLGSGLFDAALSTWTLCTIPDLPAALGEILRVLRPGGSLHFVEHGHAPDERVARWQRRAEPVQKRLAGGCHLTRRIPDQIARAGFVITELDEYYSKGEPRILGYTFEGMALKG